MGTLAATAAVIPLLDLRDVGRRIRAARQAQGLTQYGLARRLGAAQGWVSDLERGQQTHIQADTVVRLCLVLHTTPDYLLGFPSTPGIDGAALPLDDPLPAVVSLARHTMARPADHVPVHVPRCATCGHLVYEG